MLILADGGDAATHAHAQFVALAAMPNTPIVLDAASLASLPAREVLVCHWPAAVFPAQCLRVVDHDAHVILGACGNAYDELEYDSVRVVGTTCRFFMTTYFYFFPLCHVPVLCTIIDVYDSE